MSFPTGQGSTTGSVLFWDGTKWTSAANPVFAAGAPSSLNNELVLFADTTGKSIKSTGGVANYFATASERGLFIQAAVGIAPRYALKNTGGGFVGWFEYDTNNTTTQLFVPVGTTFKINGGNGVNVGGYVFPATPGVAPDWDFPNSGLDGTPLRLDLPGGQLIFDGVLTNMVNVSYGVSLLSGGATPSVVWGTASKFQLTLDQNATVSFGDPFAATDLTLIVLNAAGAFSVTWPVSVLWPGGTAPALNVANSKTKIEFYFDGTNYWGSYDLNYA